jgi:integrase
MASVHRRVEPSTGKVFYQAQWSFYDGQGKRHRKTQVFDKQSDAKSHAARMEVQCERRNIGDPKKMTFEMLKDQVLKHWENSNKQLEITTLVHYERHLNMLAQHIGSIRIDKLSAFHLDNAFATMRVSGGVSHKPGKEGAERERRGLSEQSLLHIYRVGSACLKQAVRWDFIERNPFERVDAPSPEAKDIRVMTEAEAIRVYEAAVKASESGKWPGYDVLVAILFCTGIRRSEVLALSFPDFDLDADEPTMSIRNTVVTGRDGKPLFREKKTKSKKSKRTVPIPAELVPMIKRHSVWIKQMALQWQGYQRDPLLLFPDFGGLPLLPGKLTTRMRQFQRQAEVAPGVQPVHGYRHGFASQLVADNTDIRTVSDMLGHSVVSFTLNTYAKKINGRDSEASKRMGQHFRSISGEK